MKKEKHDMHLPHHVYEGIGIDNHPRKFRFWHDIIPFFVWWVENEVNLHLHPGYNSDKIYSPMREETASKLGSQYSSNRKNNHG